MRAMLLTAGFGERMFPLTESLPKPAIPVLGRPMVIQCIRWLATGTSPEKVVLNLHHLPEVMRDLLGDGSDYGLPPILFSEEQVLLGTAGGVRNARELLTGDGPIVVCNGDFLSDIDLSAVLATHQASGLPATLVLTRSRAGYSRVETGKSGRVISLAGRPEVDPGDVDGAHLFTGCQVIDESLLDRLPTDGASDWVRDLYWDLAAQGQLGAYIHDGFWREFGSPGLYLEGSLSLLNLSARRRVRVTDHDQVRRVGSAVGALGPGVRYDARSAFEGHVALGFASHVSRGCHVRNSVVMPESWVGPDCRLDQCVVGPGIEVPAGLEVTRSLICKAPTEGHERVPTMRVEGDLGLMPLSWPEPE